MNRSRKSWVDAAKHGLKFEERMLNGAGLSPLKGLDYSLGQFPSAKALGYFHGSSGAAAVGIVALNDGSRAIET